MRLKKNEYALNITMPKDLANKVKAIADRNNISLASQVRLALVALVREENGEV